MSWATDAAAALEVAKSDIIAVIAIIDVALPEMEEGTPEREAAEDMRAKMVAALAVVNATLLIVTPFA